MSDELMIQPQRVSTTPYLLGGAALGAAAGYGASALYKKGGEAKSYEELIQKANENDKVELTSKKEALEKAEKELAEAGKAVYDGNEKKVLDAFAEHPEADFLLFNMRVGETRATYHTTKFHRVHVWNAGRYPTYSFAVRREKLHASNVTFSLLFGGGAKYSNGEDSLFLKECIQYGLKVYAVPAELGAERERESTWFKGYTDKFFLDRGVLYHFLYGALAYPMAVRFILAHGKVMCAEIPKKNALALMKKGIRSVEGL